MQITEKAVPVLYSESSECCGCGACFILCPVGAISMKEDAEGFLYPQIDEEKCIRCYKCKKACIFRN